ncbi:MAG: hypothetical protein QGH76_00470, partial [Phycisphaerales bacterium]|nr:hypothetical protein [Phycisphaerales bacterium]
MFHMILIPVAVIAASVPSVRSTFDGEQIGTLPPILVDRPLPGRSADASRAEANEARWGPQRTCCDMPDWTHAWSDDGSIVFVLGGLCRDEQTPLLVSVNNMNYRFSIFEGSIENGPTQVFDMTRMDGVGEEMDLLANTPQRQPDLAFRPRSGCVLPGCILVHCQRSRLIDIDGEMDWASEGVSIIAITESDSGWTCEHVYDGPVLSGDNPWIGWPRGYTSSMANYFPTAHGVPLTEAFIPFVDYINHIPSPTGGGQCFLLKAVRDDIGHSAWRFEGPVLLHEFNDAPPLHAHAAAWTPNGVLLAVGDSENSDVRLLTCDDWSDWTNLDLWTVHTGMHGGPLQPGGENTMAANQFWATCPGPDVNTVLIGADNVSTAIMSASPPADPADGVQFNPRWGRQMGDPVDQGGTQTTCSLMVAPRPEAGGPVLARVYMERAQSGASEVRLLLSEDRESFATIAGLPNYSGKVSGATLMGNHIVMGLSQALEAKGIWSMPLPDRIWNARGLLIEPSGSDLLRLDTSLDVQWEPGSGSDVTTIARSGFDELGRLAAAAPGVGEVWRIHRESTTSSTVATCEFPFADNGCSGSPLYVRAWICNLAPGVLRVEERLEVGFDATYGKVAIATSNVWRPATLMSGMSDLPNGVCPQFRLTTTANDDDHPPVDFMITLDGVFDSSFGQWTPADSSADATPPPERVEQPLPDLGESWTVSIDVVLPETGVDRGLSEHLPRWPICVLPLKGGDQIRVYASPASERIGLDLVRDGAVLDTIVQTEQRLLRLDTLHIDIAAGPGRLGLRSRCGGDRSSVVDWPGGMAVELSGRPIAIRWGDAEGTIFAPMEVMQVAMRGETLDVDIGLDSESGPMSGTCPGDMNADEVVDVNDLLVMAAAWGPCGDDPC